MKFKKYSPEEKAELLSRFDEAKARGLSHEEASRSIGVSGVTVYAWKSNKKRTRPRNEKIKVMEVALPPDEIEHRRQLVAFVGSAEEVTEAIRRLR